MRDPLPFRDNTVDVFYSHHVILHLPDTSLEAHLADMFRCLKPGGLVRLAGPNGDSAIRKFLEGDLEWFGPFPDSRKSVGGRFVNFMLCRGEHLTILSQSYFRELLGDAGFTDLDFRLPKTTGVPELIDEPVLRGEYEPTPDTPRTLVVEARKPRDGHGP